LQKTLFAQTFNKNVTFLGGNWGSWTAFASCSVTCGGGTQMRTRNCDSPAPSNGGTPCVGSSTYIQTCNNAACPVSKYSKFYMLLELEICYNSFCSQRLALMPLATKF